MFFKPTWVSARPQTVELSCMRIPSQAGAWCGAAVLLLCAVGITAFTTVHLCVCVALTGDDVRASFSKAMVMWERETCIRFVPRTTEEDYVELGEGG